MFNIKVKMQFIDMKSMGMPMYKIANELGVHRATIMRWNRELAPYILIARQDAIDELLHDNGCLRIHRIEKISRYLTLFYGMLDMKEEENDMDITEIINHITKLTKLLMIESNAKSPEAILKNDKDYLSELPDDEDDFNSTVWVTDKEKFTKYEPDDDVLSKSEDELNEYIDDINKSNKENAGFRNSSPKTVQDISDKAPEIQEIFNRSLSRSNPEIELRPTEKCNNNVTMKAKDVKIKRKVLKRKKTRG